MRLRTNTKPSMEAAGAEDLPTPENSSLLCIPFDEVLAGRSSNV